MTSSDDHAIRSAGRTHRGAVRAENQDAFLDRPDLGLWLVADGMGGHSDGAHASRLIVEQMGAMAAAASPDAFLAELRARLMRVNQRLRAEAYERAHDAVIASTVVALVLRDGLYACVWAGDSRLYLLRDGAMRRISRDHSRVQELIDAGALTPARAESHPEAHVVTRAVGAEDWLEPEIRRDSARAGDIFLLCSDGLTKAMREEEIAAALAGGAAEDSVAGLIAGALDRGANDNVTAVVVRLGEKP